MLSDILATLVTTKIWPPLNQTALDIAKTDIEEMTIPLRALAPDTGAYINEVRLPLLFLFIHALYLAHFSPCLNVHRRAH
jgi:hypothetical protein